MSTYSTREASPPRVRNNARRIACHHGGMMWFNASVNTALDGKMAQCPRLNCTSRSETCKPVQTASAYTRSGEWGVVGEGVGSDIWGKSDKLDISDKSGKSGFSDKSDKSDEPDRSGKSDKADKSDDLGDSGSSVCCVTRLTLFGVATWQRSVLRWSHLQTGDAISTT